MTNILARPPPVRLPAVIDSFNHHHHHNDNRTDYRNLPFVYSNPSSCHMRTSVSSCPKRRRTRGSWAVFAGRVEDGSEGDDDDDDVSEEKNVNENDSQKSSKNGPVSSDDILREKLEKIVGVDDSSFSGIDLATLIRNKYGRSYDVQLIKKEFMGRNLLAMNVMWKYMEQRSFPLTEEEYILRLDDVANNLRCWGAVSHVRSSLEKLKERPRIGKAVSIFIDMDESGGRANEWIYK